MFIHISVFLFFFFLPFHRRCCDGGSVGVQSHCGGEGKHAASPSRASKFRSENLAEREHVQRACHNTGTRFAGRVAVFAAVYAFAFAKQKICRVVLGRRAFFFSFRFTSALLRKRQCDNNTDARRAGHRRTSQTASVSMPSDLGRLGVSLTCL